MLSNRSQVAGRGGGVVHLGSEGENNRDYDIIVLLWKPGGHGQGHDLEYLGPSFD